MALKCGIVGLPNVGKSTLFNALTAAKALAANYPFATKDPNVGIITVPDLRLDELARLVSPEKVIPTTVEIVDIAGLIKGASKGEGLGNQFLANIREVDAIVHVVRCFVDDNVVHVDGNVDPVRDKEIIDMELIFKDMVMNEMMLLTAKPVIYVCNVDEESALEGNNLTKAFAELVKDENAEVILISAAIEADIIELDDPEERMEFVKEMGLDEPGVNRVIRACYSILNLITYFTAGEKEVRAWTIVKETKAPGAAGVIHTDFEKGFIRAEVIHYDDFVEYGSEAAVKDAGKLGIEGKEYVVLDGDVMHFRFNV